MKSIAERCEERAAGYAPPLCPFCDAGNLIGRWEGPLGEIASVAFSFDGRIERGSWEWECVNCGESGPWLPELAPKADPFIFGQALLASSAGETPDG